MNTFTFASLPIQLETREICVQNTHPELTHWHDTLELIQVQNGQMHCQVNESDLILYKGDICIINQEQLHRIYSEKENCQAQVLSIDPMMLSSIQDLFHTLIVPVISDPDFTHIRMHGRNSHAKLIAEFMKDMDDLAKKQPPGYELQALAYVAMILRQVYLVYQEQPLEPEHNEDLRLQKKMTTFIYEQYHESIGLSDIANAGGMSRSKCSLLFKKYTNTSPIEFLNRYRLEIAAHLLKTTNASIATIAFDCGFHQQSYFNRLFQREYGQSPNAYRKA